MAQLRQDVGEEAVAAPEINKRRFPFKWSAEYAAGLLVPEKVEEGGDAQLLEDKLCRVGR